MAEPSSKTRFAPTQDASDASSLPTWGPTTGMSRRSASRSMAASTSPRTGVIDSMYFSTREETMSATSDLHDDRAALLAHRDAGLDLAGDVQAVPRPRLEPPAVPGAGDDPAGDRPFAQRPAAVGAGPVEGLERAADAEHGDLAAVHVEGARGP